MTTPNELLTKELAKYEKALRKSNEFLLQGTITIEKNNEHKKNLVPIIKEYEQAIFLLKPNRIMKPNYNFVTPFAMRCDEEQFETVENELKEMGYKPFRTITLNSYSYLTNNHCGNNGELYNTASYKNTHSSNGRLLLETFNRPLLLALAAMTDKADGIKGEWWKCIRDAFNKRGELTFKKDGIYNQICNDIDTDYALLDINGNKNGFGNRMNSTFFVKATATELIEHFTKVEQKQYNPIECEMKFDDGEVARLTNRIDDLEYNVRLLTANMDKLIQQPQPEPTKLADKQEVWAWDDDDTHLRRLGFYDAKNNALFYYDGKRDGDIYDHYEPIPADQIPAWMKDAKPKLQD